MPIFDICYILCFELKFVCFACKFVFLISLGDFVSFDNVGH